MASANHPAVNPSRHGTIRQWLGRLVVLRTREQTLVLLAEGLFELRGHGMNDLLTHNLYDTIIRLAQEGFPNAYLVKEH